MYCRQPLTENTVNNFKIKKEGKSGENRRKCDMIEETEKVVQKLGHHFLQ